MKKKLLAGILALALCSTNMPPQTIFAGEFTSGNPDVVSEEETPEIFTNEEQEAAGETDEELSVFSSEEVPEFDDAPDEAMAATENAQNGVIDLTEDANVTDGVYTINIAEDYKFTCKKSPETSNRIVVDGTNTSEQHNINIYLDNVNIKTSAGSALQINNNVKATVTIYLTGINNLTTTNQSSAGLQKDNEAQLIITNASDTTTGILKASSDGSGYGAGIGSGNYGSCKNITINSGFVDAKSKFGAGIGSGHQGSCDNITIKSGSVNAKSMNGAGIGGGHQGSCNNITINSGSVNAKSMHGAGIGSGNYGSCNNITIKSGSVTASSTSGAGIGGGLYGSCNNITISGGSVNAQVGCTPHQNLDSSGSYDPKSPEVYLYVIPNKKTELVAIDNKVWEPSNHKAVESTNTNLYAWLTGEDHLITVGEETKSYIFNSNLGTFSEGKRDVTSDIFEFNGSEFTYDGNTHSPNITTKNNIKGVGNFSVKYFKENDPTNEITVPKDVGTYTVKITVEEGDFYKESSGYLTSDDWKFAIKLTPTITTYTDEYDGDAHPVINIDQKTIPSDSTIEYSINDGQTWNILNSNNDIPTVRTVTEAENTKIFIRISNSNYVIWTSQEYKAIISRATQTPNFPSPSNTKIPVPWSCKKVGDITTILPEHWIWKDTDKSKELKVEEPISADAVYNGTDKGNYVTETVTYTITRKECEHKNTVGVYYSSPSCTSNGYSGDTYCNDCERTIYYGSTIPAYGHDYDNGVITTEPTAETDGIITYTCKRCKHQDTKNLGKLGDGEPYIEGSFQKKGWDAVNDLIKASKEKDTISITLNGAKVFPATVLSEIKGKDISLNLDMENGFIWKINGTSITAETPADIDLSVTNTAEYIPAALYSLISANQNDFGFHLGRNGAFDFPAVLSVKADASCAGFMANLFWYDVENGVLQCIQTVTVGGAFERSIPYADFTLSKGQDYFIAFGTESLNGRVIHTDGSITDENGVYLRPANTKISSHSIDRNKLTVKLSKGCAGAQGYDFVISKKSNMLQTGKFSQTVSSTGKPQASFRYLAKGTWYVAARSWVLDVQGNKVYGSWTKIKKIKITVVTPQQPKIRNITVKGNTVTVTYTKCKNATGYEILLGNKYKTSAGEKYPVKKHLKRTGNTTTVTFTNVKKGTWYVTIRAWNQTSKDKSRVYSPYSSMKKFKTKK
ncbi:MULTISPECIES: hypothetical protein [Blautia]|uniref:Fibronectin type-III domain-containing protein n=2 Tax=Blautia TaxID=572511 RepID=A0A174DN83_9FIRM|nr:MULTISPECIES: hypothetical protein [Blautia]MCB6356594.1 carbohydrate-binding domain-containing protein [Blautia wexlerae]MCB8629856.1 carbohydrate-binding domain-containing protein [Blautia sp. DFI.6.71]MCC2180539.1 carbohydrate-binding domain-containing protein [Blautia wexlerae]CUO25340.1 Uncharacterised protein [Blautia obeum]